MCVLLQIIIPKLKNEPLGVVIVESGWGSMVPTIVLASMAPGGAAARCSQLNVGDQIMSVNGVSLVGLPLSTCQNYVKVSHWLLCLTVVSHLAISFTFEHDFNQGGHSPGKPGKVGQCQNGHYNDNSNRVKLKYTWICIECLHANASNALRYDHTVLPANNTISAFTPQSQSITTLWPVLLRLPTEGWPG